MENISAFLNCGAAHDASARFCGGCGGKLGGGGATSAPAPRTSSPSQTRAVAGDSSARDGGAYHGPAYGLDAELKAKQDAKYDPGQEREIRNWMASKGVSVQGDFHGALKSGVLLCELANKLSPGSVPRVQRANAPFVQMVLYPNSISLA
jgi:hypothetical protein